ncbi:MAG: acetate--CoA ligase family protein [Syntrophorhabdaceae bacterium]|jgi:acetyltransferase|nr:acetate--CoA ligase family protein [Syntrophorhabdaceae bacterium]MDD5242828.1 acetate--CoA ligase family protein [Syntrophorhabdaceae bacterium]
METIFFPESVVVFGVSNSPANQGRIIVENLDRFGFAGKIYLVGSKAGVLAERQIFTHVGEIPGVPELAVILIPAGGLAQTLEACGEKGIGNIVIETAGFSEFSEERKGLEKEILRIASKWGMKIIGPNCVGIVNVENGLALPFYPLFPHVVKKGPLSIISQSGGLVHDIMVLCNIENIGMNKMASIGNKLVCDENDVLEYLISDPATGIVGLYLENIRDGRRFMKLAASTDKPIILLKANRSPGSREIARFHTSALAGDDLVVDKAMKQAGVHRVQNLREMVDTFKAFSLPPLKGPRLAVIARSGGHAVLSADSVYFHGFRLASFSGQFFDMLSEKTKAGIIRRTNPLDLGDVFDFTVYFEITESALLDRDVDAVLIIHSYALGVDLEPSKQFISDCKELSQKYKKPVVFCTIAHKEDRLALQGATDFPLFTHVDDALTALSKVLEHSRRQARPSPEHIDIGRHEERQSAPSRLPPGITPADEIFNLLRVYGLSVADYRVVADIDEGLKAARDIGFPVALKTASTRILHKTERDGVMLDIPDEVSLESAFRAMEADSYLLQKMAPPGCEIIIGGRNDPEFGPIILCGLGGIFVEIYKDIEIRVAPIDEKTAREMIAELSGADILKGFRGKKPYDVDYLANILVNVSRLLSEHSEIRTLDINPLILFEKGGGGIVVDAKLEIE